MSKKGRQFFQEKIGVTPQNWPTVMTKKQKRSLVLRKK